MNMMYVGTQWLHYSAYVHTIGQKLCVWQHRVLAEQEWFPTAKRSLMLLLGAQVLATNRP